MSFTDKLKKFTSDAVEKGKGLAEQGKLALDNQKQLEAIKAAKAQIGAYVVENGLLVDDDFVLGQLSAIAAADEIIERNNSRIAEIKAEDASCAPAEPEETAPGKRFCSDCGHELAQDAKFCPGCGAKL